MDEDRAADPRDSNERDSNGSDGMPIPDNPTGEAQEQLSENDEHLREGDERTPDETVPET